MSKHVMVVGTASEVSPVVSALRDRNLDAWSDRVGRAAVDMVSFDWADALVVIDSTPHLETEHVRPVVEFPGAKVLCTAATPRGERRVELLERGFDVVLDWPAAPELIAAYVDRFLAHAPTVPHRVVRT